MDRGQGRRRRLGGPTWILGKGGRNGTQYAHGAPRGAVRRDDHVHEVDRARRGDAGWPAFIAWLARASAMARPSNPERHSLLLLAVPRGTERPRITPPPPHGDANIEHLVYDLREVRERLGLVPIQPRSAR